MLSTFCLNLFASFNCVEFCLLRKKEIFTRLYWLTGCAWKNVTCIFELLGK